MEWYGGFSFFCFSTLTKIRITLHFIKNTGSILYQNILKPFCDRGSAPDATEGAYYAPQDPLIQWCQGFFV